MDFGDLSDDHSIQDKLANFHSSIEKIDNHLKLSLSAEKYETLTIKEKVDYDLFMAYALNTLYWLYLKTRGQDPAKTEVKDQLNRIKEYMLKAKEAHDRNTIRPHIDKAVARRFIKHGIHQNDATDTKEPPKKKIKLSKS